MENIQRKETRYSMFGDRQRLKEAFEKALILCLVSLFAAGIFLAVVNDVYAFVKPEGIVKISISEGSTLGDIANQLGDNGVIDNPIVFRLYVMSKGKEDIFPKISGELEFNSSMSYREILAVITAAKNKT